MKIKKEEVEAEAGGCQPMRRGHWSKFLNEGKRRECLQCLENQGAENRGARVPVALGLEGGPGGGGAWKVGAGSVVSGNGWAKTGLEWVRDRMREEVEQNA